VIEMCKGHGAALPVFEERQGFFTVRFRAQMVAGSARGTGQPTAQVTAQVTAEVIAQVAAFCREPKPAKDVMTELGLKHWKTFQENYLNPLMAMGILERTIPDKPRSRMQRYRTTEAGLEVLKPAPRNAGEPKSDTGAPTRPAKGSRTRRPR
jgi:ATP-dependent DNA helicase RecG